MFQNRHLSLRILALLIALLLSAAPLCALATEEPVRLDTYDKANPQNLIDDDLIAKAALVMDADSGMVLYDKSGERKTYPASTTKIMTCLLALEHCENLNELVTIGPEANDVPSDSSKLGVKQGEQIQMIDLLYGMMIMSGNDASMSVAKHISGSVEAFVELMNKRAKELGCTKTTFVNPHGYHDEAHVSTAHDLALIAREAMKNRTFREIAAAKSYTMPPTNEQENKRRLETRNSMFVAGSSNKYYYPDLVGIKTGYHSKAGQCFVGAAVKDGVTIISVILKSDKNGRWTDTARLMDYAITRYDSYTFSQLFDAAPVHASVKNASRDDENAGVVKLSVVPGSALDTYKMRCLPEQRDDYLAQFAQNLTVRYTSSLEAPIQAGDILGTVSMPVNGETVTATVISSRDVAAEKEPFTMRSMLPDFADMLTSNALWIGAGVLVAIIALIVLIRVRVASRNRRRRREMLRRRKAAYDRYRADQ